MQEWIRGIDFGLPLTPDAGSVRIVRTMSCPDCDGDDLRCFRCDGTGELCDVCGEAAPYCDCDEDAMDETSYDE